MLRKQVKTQSATALQVWTVVLAVISFGQAPAQTSRSATNIIPLIVMDDVPLEDAIRNLARQSGLNYIIDPRVFNRTSGGQRSPGGSVTERWEQLSANDALNRVLDKHSLLLIQNPATMVARIVKSDQSAVPLTVEQVGNDTNAVNAVIPLIMMDDVPLRDAIRNLARQLALEISFDSELSANDGILSQQVSLRWQNIRPRQALAALLDNYDLIIKEDPASRTGRISLRPGAKSR